MYKYFWGLPKRLSDVIRRFEKKKIQLVGIAKKNSKGRLFNFF